MTEGAGQATIVVTLSALNPVSSGLSQNIVITLLTTGAGTATGKHILSLQAVTLVGNFTRCCIESEV